MPWSYNIRISVPLSFHSLKLTSSRQAWRAPSQIFLREITTARAMEKMSARCSALLPAQTMTKIGGKLLAYLFSIYGSLSGHRLFGHSLLMADPVSKAPTANILSFFFFWVRVGVFFHYHIHGTCHWWGEGHMIKVYNWNCLDHRTKGQDATVARCYSES